MGLSTDGVVQLFDNMEKLTDEFDKFIRQFMLEMGLRSIAKVKKRTPVRTGFLRNSWQLSDVYRKDDYVYIELQNIAEYASYVEEGHASYVRKKGESESKVGKYVEGYHMARISLYEIRNEIPIRFSDAFKAWTQRIKT